MDVQAAYDRLVESHPVTLDGVVPSKAERKKFSADDQRVLYERWLKAQMKLRKHNTSKLSLILFLSNIKWKGLLVTDVEGKGKGVVATRRFQVGEVICDYHGRAITAKEGKDIHMNTSEEETGYMFFYKDKTGWMHMHNTEKDVILFIASKNIEGENLAWLS
uniref:SET domain-containing protein n=1 Tax=Gouania willdenowi TaxID=441366 RepID=A0A8C5D3F8_GOUWI